MTAHCLLQFPGNNEADHLAKIRWLEEVPAEEIATELQCRLKHVG